MAILQFRRYTVVEEIIDALREEEDDEVVEALIVGRRKSGKRFSYATATDNLAELIGYLEAIKTDLALELMDLADRDEEE